MKRQKVKKGVIEKVILDDLFSRFDNIWKPQLAGIFNGHLIKLIKFVGPFDWQYFETSDVLYHVFLGKMFIQFDKKNIDKNIELEAGESIIIPRKVRHRAFAMALVYLVIIQSKSEKR